MAESDSLRNDKQKGGHSKRSGDELPLFDLAAVVFDGQWSLFDFFRGGRDIVGRVVDFSHV
jgi:hypothetical protein